MIFPKLYNTTDKKIDVSSRRQLLLAHRYYLIKKQVQVLLNQLLGYNQEMEDKAWFIKFEGNQILLDFRRLNPMYRVLIKTRQIELEAKLLTWQKTQVIFSDSTNFKFCL